MLIKPLHEIYTYSMFRIRINTFLLVKNFEYKIDLNHIYTFRILWKYLHFLRGKHWNKTSVNHLKWEKEDSIWIILFINEVASKLWEIRNTIDYLKKSNKKNCEAAVKKNSQKYQDVLSFLIYATCFFPFFKK